ncbi:hypothetical protein C0993_004970, partial [Termitomyces sp. T159_Od127]
TAADAREDASLDVYEDDDAGEWFTIRKGKAIKISSEERGDVEESEVEVRNEVQEAMEIEEVISDEDEVVDESAMDTSAEREELENEAETEELKVEPGESE